LKKLAVDGTENWTTYDLIAVVLGNEKASFLLQHAKAAAPTNPSQLTLGVTLEQEGEGAAKVTQRTLDITLSRLETEVMLSKDPCCESGKSAAEVTRDAQSRALVTARDI